MTIMFIKARIQRTTGVFALATLVCIIAGYAAVAASTNFRPPTVVVTFNIEKVVADLTEKAESEARLRALFTKIEDEQNRRLETMRALEDSLETAAEADREMLIEQLEQKTLELGSYRLFASLQVDNERSLMLRDIYMKIRDAVSEIAQKNGYDIVLISDVDREVVINPKSDVPREFQILERIGSQRAIYASSQTDITGQIVTHMNLEWDKRTDK